MRAPARASDSFYADDAEERHRAGRNPERQRPPGRLPAGCHDADAALHRAAAARTDDAPARRVALPLDADRDRDGRGGARRRALPLPAPDARVVRAAHEERDPGAAPSLAAGPEREPARDCARDRLRHAQGNRRGDRPGIALRHDHVRPRRPAAEGGLAALVPARPRSPGALPQPAHRGRPHQLGMVALRRAGNGRDRGRSHRHHARLSDHGQLPRLQAAGEQARRRVHRRRPPLPEHTGRSGRLREDRPPTRLPEARRTAGPRLRAFPSHRLRPVPARAPAAIRDRRARADRVELLHLHGLQDRRRAEGQRRDRERSGRRGSGRRRALLPQVPARPAVRPLLPDEDRGPGGNQHAVRAPVLDDGRCAPVPLA